MIKAKFKSRVTIPRKISAQLDLPGRCREEDSYCGGWGGGSIHAVGLAQKQHVQAL